MKIKLIIIIASIALVLGIGGTATAIIYNNSDEVVFRHSVSGVIEDIFERDDVSAITNIFDGGSVDIELNSVKNNGIDILAGKTFSGKIYFSDSALYIENAKFNYAHNCLEASAYIDKDLIYIEENNILKEKYGIALSDKSCSELFDDSVFSASSNSKYSLSEYETEIIKSFLDAYTLCDFDEIEEVYTNLIKECYEIFVENCTFDSQSKELRIGEERKNYRVITVEFDSYDLSCMLYSIISYIKEYDELYEASELFYSLCDNSGTSFDKFWDTTLQSLESSADNLKTYDQIYEIEIVTPKTSSKMLKFSFVADNTDIIEIDLGENGIKSSSEITVAIADLYKIAYEIDNSKENRTIYTLTQTFDGETFELFSLIVDEKRKTYTLETDISATAVTLSGTYSKKGDKTTLTVDTLGNFKVDAVLIFDTKDKIRTSGKDFINVLELREKEVDTIAKKLDNEIAVIERSLKGISETLKKSYTYNE